MVPVITRFHCIFFLKLTMDILDTMFDFMRAYYVFVCLYINYRVHIEELLWLGE